MQEQRQRQRGEAEIETDAAKNRVNYKGGVTVTVGPIGVVTLVSFVRLMSRSKSFSREDAAGDGDGDGDSDKTEG